MIVLICGDRNWTDEETIHEYIHTLPPDSVVIQGMCKGADKIARKYALLHDLAVLDFPADWIGYGLAAGPIRNKRMLDEGKPERVVAFHNDLSKSKGTANMLKQATDRGIPTEIHTSNGVSVYEHKKNQPPVSAF